MSHFTVLVIGDNVEEQLAPFHEFECTGINDQYVQDVDQTEEVLKEFSEATRTMVRIASGELVDRYDDRFYRDPTAEESKTIGPLAGSGAGGGISWHSRDWGDGRGYRAKVHAVPDGAEQVDVPYEDFGDWLEGWHGKKLVPHGAYPDLENDHKYGYALLDEAGKVTKVIDRTNPNKKWDWWVIGGRWSGLLKLKPGRVGAAGEPGLRGSHFAKGKDRADQARKGDIDFDGMRDDAGAKAGALWDKAHGFTGGKPWDSWEVVRARHPGDIDAARDDYHSQPSVKALTAGDRDVFGWDLDDTLAGPRDSFVQAARDGACATFAVLRDGLWAERGDMGWWGMVADEMDRALWNRKLSELLDGLPDTTLLTVVDCHI